MIAILTLCFLIANAAALPMSQTGDNSNSGTANQSDFAICYVNGTAVKPGQRATQGNFVFECQLTDGWIKTTIVACLDDGDENGNRAEHPINDRWIGGKQRPFRYVYECAKIDTLTVRRIVQCFYDSPDGSAKLDLNAGQQRIGKNLVGCVRQGQYGAQYEITYGQPDVQAAAGTSNSNTNNVGNNANVANDAPKDQVRKCK